MLTALSTQDHPQGRTEYCDTAVVTILGQLPYEEKHDSTYNQVAAATSKVSILPSRYTPENILIAGSCPRCEHNMVFEHSLASSRDVNWAALRDWAVTKKRRDITKSLEKVVVRVICRCSAQHPDTPRNRPLGGCGAYWNLTVKLGKTDD